MILLQHYYLETSFTKIINIFKMLSKIEGKITFCVRTKFIDLFCKLCDGQRTDDNIDNSHGVVHKAMTTHI